MPNVLIQVLKLYLLHIYELVLFVFIINFIKILCFTIIRVIKFFMRPSELLLFHELFLFLLYAKYIVFKLFELTLTACFIAVIKSELCPEATLPIIDPSPELSWSLSTKWYLALNATK